MLAVNGRRVDLGSYLQLLEIRAEEARAETMAPDVVVISCSSPSRIWASFPPVFTQYKTSYRECGRAVLGQTGELPQRNGHL